MDQLSEFLVTNTVRRPDEPRHFMQMKPVPYPVAAQLGPLQIAYSSQALMLQEVGQGLYSPVIYFPREDVLMKYLYKSPKTTSCPLKGSTEYFDLRADGLCAEEGAWSYTTVFEFDERLAQLENLVAFDTSKVRITEFTTFSAT